MIIEIRKVGFSNKGAELMLYAILQKLSKGFPDAQFVMAPTGPNGAAPFSKRAKLGLYQKAFLWRNGIQFGKLFSLMPKKVREMYGIFTEKEIDVVIDSAGFEYSDQWGQQRCLELAASSRVWKKNGTKLIMLPQAFGPFTSPKIKSAIKEAVNNSLLVFPRDKISYDNITGIVGGDPKIKIAPDFTNIIEGIKPEGFDSENCKVAIIPNYRMVDKSDAEGGYLPFMVKSAKYLLSKNARPFILIHESKSDLHIAEKINTEVGNKLPVIEESNPLVLKGILGMCDATLGSRFHGLVSALSQGVPSLATGWSHKYQMLFEDYDFSDGVIDIQTEDEVLYKKMDLILNEDSKTRIKDRLIQRAKILKHGTETMWSEVIAIINS